MAITKEIQNKFNELEGKLEEKFTDVKADVKAKISAKGMVWLWTAIGLIVVVGILVIFIFNKHGKQDESYQLQIHQLDSTLKYQEKYIESLQAGQAARDSIISDQIERIKNNRPSQTKILHDINNTPASVAPLDNRELHSGITNY